MVDEEAGELWGEELFSLGVDYLLWASVTCHLLLHFAKSGGQQLLLPEEQEGSGGRERLQEGRREPLRPRLVEPSQGDYSGTKRLHLV